MLTFDQRHHWGLRRLRVAAVLATAHRRAARPVGEAFAVLFYALGLLAVAAFAQVLLLHGRFLAKPTLLTKFYFYLLCIHYVVLFFYFLLGSLHVF